MDHAKNTRRTILTCLVFGAVTLAAYWPVFPNDFANYDDDNYILENPHVSTGLSWGNVVWAFQAFHASNWHPLTWLSHMLDCQIFGLNPTGHHVINLGLHIANTLLLFLLLKRVTGAFWRCALLAGAFALHPLHVESVAWVAERKDVLSGLFFLLTLWTYTSFVETKGPKATPETKRSSFRTGLLYGLSLLLFALGLMAKPMLVTVPFVLLLWDFWPLGRPEWANRGAWIGIILEKVPFLLLTVGSSVVTFVAQARGGAVMALDALPVAERIG